MGLAAERRGVRARQKTGQARVIARHRIDTERQLLGGPLEAFHRGPAVTRFFSARVFQ